MVDYLHWPPNVIDSLYLDDIDYHGLKYWYKAAVKAAEAVQNAGKKK